MRTLTAKVTELVDNVKVEGKVVETLAQANETLTKIDDMVTDNHSDIVVILDNLLATSNELRRVMESGKIDRTFEDASAAMASADSLMGVLTESGPCAWTRSWSSSTTGDGTAALLLNDPTLYTTADSTMTSLQAAGGRMRRNPKKYFKMNVMDF